MIKLRITSDGLICGLWTDQVQLSDIGTLKVRRASHVEFDDRLQCWAVREARATTLWSRCLQRLFDWPTSQVLHHAASRTAALAWEHEHFQPGGPQWKLTQA